MKRIALGAGVAALAIGGVAAAGLAGGSDEAQANGFLKNVAFGERTYNVTVENLSNGEQWFSPPFLAVHNRRADVVEPGGIASHVVATIAEDGNNGPAVEAFSNARGVKSAETGVDSQIGGPQPIRPGETQQYQIQGRPFERISLLAMAIQTNDGLVFLDSERLGRRSKTFQVDVYDAGSEKNNELSTHVPGPPFGGGARDQEGNVVRPHPGIQGGADIDPAVYGWSGPVAEITIEPADQ